MPAADDVASDLALALSGEVLGTQVAIGYRDGYRVRCHVISKVLQSETNTASMIEVGLRTRHRLELWVVRGNPEREAVAYGDEVDIEVGTGTFDDLFHVEGAPVDVVRVLFDAAMCLMLANLPEPRLSTERVDGEPVLRLQLATWSETEILHGVAALVTLASRIDEAYEVADAVHTHRDSPYRNDVTPRALIDAARASDFEALARVRRSRTWWIRFRRAFARFTSRSVAREKKSSP